MLPHYANDKVNIYQKKDSRYVDERGRERKSEKGREKIGERKKKRVKKKEGEKEKKIAT